MVRLIVVTLLAACGTPQASNTPDLEASVAAQVRATLEAQQAAAPEVPAASPTAISLAAHRLNGLWLQAVSDTSSMEWLIDLEGGMIAVQSRTFTDSNAEIPISIEQVDASSVTYTITGAEGSRVDTLRLVGDDVAIWTPGADSEPKRLVRVH